MSYNILSIQVEGEFEFMAKFKKTYVKFEISGLLSLNSYEFPHRVFLSGH